MLLILGYCLGAAPVPPPRSIAVLPLGSVDPSLVEAVRQRLESTFACTTTVLPTRALPKKAYFAPRHRYRGTLILDELSATIPLPISNLLGITSQDISVTKGPIPDWGVFGVAYLSQRPAVISTFRLGRNQASRTLILRRVQTVAVHEVGHTFGLNHCPSPHCVMEDARGTIQSVDASSEQFCSTCRAFLGSNLRSHPKPRIGGLEDTQALDPFHEVE